MIVHRKAKTKDQKIVINHVNWFKYQNRRPISSSMECDLNFDMGIYLHDVSPE